VIVDIVDEVFPAAAAGGVPECLDFP